MKRSISVHPHRPLRLSLILTLALTLLFSTLTLQTVQAATFNVGCPGGSINANMDALYAAITTANSNNANDVINLTAGCIYRMYTSVNPVEIGGDSGHSLTINGNGATISGNNLSNVLLVDGSANATINRVTIRDGESAIPADGVTPLAFDQRGTGFPRKVGAHVDVGAYEAGVVATALLSTTRIVY